MLKKYITVMEELKNEPGRIAKENLLKKYEDVEGLKEIFQFVFNPLIVTGLAKRKIEKNVTLPHSIDISTIREAMTFVKDNNTGNDKVIATIQNYLNKLETDEERELVKSILVKDLPIGLSRTTLNKVYGKDFINKYSVQLAGTFNPEKTQFTGPFALTLKLDGNRVTFFNLEDGLKAFTRSGKEVEGLVEIEEDFKLLPKNMVYDGELLAKNPGNIPSKDLFNMTQTIVRKKGEKKGLEFVIFDALPIEDFNEGKSKHDYSYRMTFLDDMFSMCVSDDSTIKRVPTYYIGEDIEQIPQVLAQVEADGFEGLMLNTLSGHYETKRTKNLLKIKTFHTEDLRCIGVKEDIRGGKCGSLTVDYRGYKVDVAGLKDAQKVEFWNNPELIVGKIIEVKYFEESKNAQGGISLRFPSFIQIREDKDEVSYA